MWEARRKTTIRNEFESDRGHIDINRRGTHRAILWISSDSMELEANTSLYPSKSKNDPKLNQIHDHFTEYV